MNPIEKILIFAIVISPFTSLRMGFFGLGEASIIFLFIYSLRKRYLLSFNNKHIFSVFWLRFLFFITLGFIYNVFVFKYKYGDIDNSIFDFFAYTMLFFSSYLLESLYKKGIINIKKILKNSFFFLALIITTLYIISQYTNTFFGLPLKYYEYFSPLVDNIHQITMLYIPLSFIGMVFFFEEKEKIKKSIILFFIIMFIYVSKETGSFKSYLGLLVGWSSYFLYSLSNKFYKKLIPLFKGMFLILVIIILLYNFTEFYSTAVQIFRSEDYAYAGREFLYKEGIKKILESPILGFGPGRHIIINGEGWDAHNTVLTILLQGGILALVLFINLSLKVYKKLIKTPESVGVLLSTLIYVLGGDVLRRLPLWLIIIVVYYYIDSQKEEKKEA